MLLRINIFANEDHNRERGEVILLDVSQMINWPLFLHHCANKLNLGYCDSGWRAHTSEGGLIRNHTELIQNDVIFLVRGNETFKFYSGRERIMDKKEEVIESPVEVVVSALAQPQQQPITQQVIRNPLIVQVKIIGNLKEGSLGFPFKLKHRDGSVRDLKRRIGKRHYNLNPLDITLINQGKEMEDSMILKDVFNDKDGKDAVVGEDIDWDKCPSVSIFLLIKPMVIYVKNLQGRTIVIDGNDEAQHIAHDSTVSRLKELLKRKSEFNRLLFNQQVLSDGERLSHYGVYSGCVVYMC
jgi:hypothetical protein